MGEKEDEVNKSGGAQRSVPVEPRVFIKGGNLL